MPLELSTSAGAAARPNERSTLVLQASFTDSSGSAVVPSSVWWALRDADGAIVNSRGSVSVTPGGTVTMVLSGADLALTGSGSNWRTFTLQSLYTSTEGVGLPLNGEWVFEIESLVGVG